jgi:transposase
LSSSALFDRELHSHVPLTHIERAAAVTLRKLGETQERAADRLGCCRQTVAHWEHTFASRRDVDDDQREGRPRATTEEEDTNIVFVSELKHFLTPRRMKRKLELDVCPHTIDNILKEAGLKGCVAQHKKQFTEEHKRKRLAFAEGYKDWTDGQWNRVLWSDEKCFYGAGFCGRVWVRRPKGEALNPEYCVDKKPHPVKVNMWACVSGQGLGYSYIFNENLDAKLLKTIISTHLLPSAELVFDEKPRKLWFFQQDNDPKHKSREISSWFHNHGITLLDFPPYSPDLNPMENLWNDVARRVEEERPETMELLQECLAKEWAKTSTHLIAKTIHSMPKRCKLVIEAQGDHIPY